jgi:hypothetical protein
MTYKELKQYVANKRKAKATEWKTQTAIHGYCRPFTDKDYTKNREVIFTGKKAHSNKISSTKLWESY